MTKEVKSLVFDLDGTLINTIPDVVHALNHTLETFGYEKIKTQQIYGLIGNGAEHLIGNAFRVHNKVLDPAKMKAALNTYLAYYAEHPIVDTKIYPDVIAVLEKLRDDGMELGICTNKSGSITRLVLERLNMQKFFRAVGCGDEVTQKKPHQQHLLDVLHEMQAEPNHCVYVGDSDVDRLTAVNAHLSFIGVSYGYQLKADGAKNMISRFSELPAALQALHKDDLP